MDGDITIRPALDRPPLPGEAFHCEDWQCPAWKVCEHHFGRSYAYAAMLDWDSPHPSARTPVYTPERSHLHDRCRYFRRDKPREWLAGWCEPLDGSWCCSGCGLPECPRRPSNVVPLTAAMKAKGLGR